MHPILVVAKREFSHRIQQRMFWIVMFLGPFFFLAILIVPIGLSMDKETSRSVLYLDESGELAPSLYSDKNFHFIKTENTLEQALTQAKELALDGVVWLGKEGNSWQCRYYKLGLLGSGNADLLFLTLQNRIYRYETTEKRNLDVPSLSFSLANTKTTGEKNSVGFVAGLFMAMLILVFVNQYSQMVLRGIVEEKQNRISELILTSVKPLHFIIGKVSGIASVAFLQMFLWSGTTGLIWLGIYRYFHLERFSNAQLAGTLKYTQDIGQTLEMNSLLNAMSGLNYLVLFTGFVFYFVFGYLLFSALFAVIGIVAGNDSDAHQLAMPIALPLALPLILLQSLVDHPHSSLARFLSFFPFTAPTTMMIRLPFGVPLSELLLSAFILALSCFLVAFCAAKIYRVGVLIYGKKPSLKEILKWAQST